MRESEMREETQLSCFFFFNSYWDGKLKWAWVRSKSNEINRYVGFARSIKQTCMMHELQDRCVCMREYEECGSVYTPVAALILLHLNIFQAGSYCIHTIETYGRFCRNIWSFPSDGTRAFIQALQPNQEYHTHLPADLNVCVVRTNY